MKAVVLSDIRRPELISLSEPRIEPHEVMLQVDYCGICGSDLHAATFDLFQVGVTMGHEFSGRIVEIGRDVTGWSVGDRVCVNPNGSYCGHCASCRKGLFNLCPVALQRSVGVTAPGGLAEFAAVDERTLHRLPDSVTPLQGAWIEPASVALRAVKRSGIQVGDSAVVFGAGPIGLLVLLMLRLAGVGRVTVVEPNEARRDMARSSGADAVVDPRAAGPELELPEGDGRPGFAFDCVGSKAVMEAAVHVLPAHGTLTVVGVAQHPIGFSPTELLFKEIQIKGSFIYNDEFRQTINLMATGKLDVSSLTSGVRPLAEAVEAIDEMRSGGAIIKYLISTTEAV
ncbi:zinc-dependent alcohol dehydrogenase [Acidisoma silvae]|uniref:Alcohol dehydrogenase catalytic domain-containing protein n=1 Tax=Acidisoma silvae TaxID=2802396 RepID=A0A963YXQ3_9PROT|nr:alcohol dehydrogenase catalytic domain-containing protein [Acidisoma silvae]MCB8878093.1 alcohol dehydrogenase catalytic domain-containing protein [Acidisoma silvae]